MTPYLLDTNICIYLIKQQPPDVLKKFRTIKIQQLFISSISIYELYFGVEKSRLKKQNLRALKQFLQPLSILDFNSESAIKAAQIRQALNAKGQPIGPYDIQIAAIAMTHSLTLITNNSKEFSRIDELKLENWVS